MTDLISGPIGTALTGLAAALALMTAVWLVSLAKRDVSIVDIFWGLGFVLVGWVYFLDGTGESARRILGPVLVTIWGFRLAIYIFWRGRGQGEDYRYAEMRERTGPSFAWRSLFTVFWLQALILWVVAMPLLQIQMNAEPAALTWLDYLGFALFAVGLFFEAVGDWQMARFKNDSSNRGKVMDRGLWRYTRHPNYFGDCTLWWGLTCFALATEGSGWVLLSPIVMTFLLLRVSGVALLEKGMKEKKPAYADYVRRTSAFFPWLPKRD